MPRNLLHPRDELVRTMERIYRYRMTTTSGGNLSILDPDGSIWITPARVDKGNIRRDDIIRVLPDGSSEGPHPPSSEFPFHSPSTRPVPTSAPSSTPTRSRWWPSVSSARSPTPASSTSPATSAETSPSPPMPCRVHPDLPTTSPKLSPRGQTPLRRPRKPRSRRRRRLPLQRIPALRNRRVHRQDHHQGPHARRCPVFD